MAFQELSFVTLGQRTMHRPLRVRMHYGHPDVFDKLFAITRGGVSKASKGINLSEDIFAGISPFYISNMLLFFCIIWFNLTIYYWSNRAFIIIILVYQIFFYIDAFYYLFIYLLKDSI